MSKKSFLTIILDSVFIVAFNVLFFLNGGTQHVTSVWTVYGFLHFAYLMVLITPLIASHGSTAVLSKTTTYTISLMYFLVNLLFSIIIFITKTEHAKLVISAETILTAIYILILVINLMADDSIEKKQSAHEGNNDFIKGISSQLKYIESIIQDKNSASKVDSLYYLAHSSPSKTSESVKNIENEIVRNINLLEEAANSQNSEELIKLSEEVERLLNKRNFELKTTK